MAAIAPIKTSTILGGVERSTSATVGFDKTYGPEGFVSPGVASWVDRSGGIPINYPRATLSVRRPNKQSRMYRVAFKLDLPTPDITAPTTVTGIQPAPSKAYSNVAMLEFMLPERGTSAERTALLSLLKSFLIATINASDDSPTDATGTPLIAAIVDLEMPYGN